MGTQSRAQHCAADRVVGRRCALRAGAVVARPRVYAKPRGVLPRLPLLMAVWWATEALPHPGNLDAAARRRTDARHRDVEDGGHGYGSSTIFLILGRLLFSRWRSSAGIFTVASPTRS